MKITRESLPDEIRYVIHAYGAGEVQINQDRYTESLIVSPQKLQTGWQHGPIEAMQPAALEALLEFDPEIILIGTGSKLVMLGPEFQARALQNGTGLEIMDTPAACRTYNILMGEGRRVVAGLVIE